MLEAGPESRIYAGLKPATTADVLWPAIANATVAEHLASFRPKPGDGVFLPAGTVHSLGDLVVFEVQENSDVTFRLYDWDHVDAKTGQPRPLQVDQAMACIDFAQSAVGPVVPVLEEAKPVLRERLFDCEHFGLWRLRGESPFRVGAEGRPRVLVCIAGEGQLGHHGANHAFGKGDVLLLPAVVGACLCRPRGACHLVGHFTAGRRLIHDETHRFRSGWHACRSKASLDAEMATRLSALLGIVKAAVISGGDWLQFEKQVLFGLPHDERLKNLYSSLPAVRSFTSRQGLGKNSIRKTLLRMKKGRLSAH